MKTIKTILMTTFLASSLSFQSCQRNSNDVWEDTKSASRYMSRGVKTLMGSSCDSRQVGSPDEFGYLGDDQYVQEGNYQAAEEHAPTEYVPLQDQAHGNELAVAEEWVPQPKETPGEAGSSIPGINAFKDPSTVSHLAPIFQNIHFDYNSSLIKGSENLEIIRKIANYMKAHPKTYVFIEGHTDERGPQAYNLALGSHRSNAVRQLLVKEGVNPDNLFTISYGKERPLVFGSYEESWSQNRRAEFKVYER